MRLNMPESTLEADLDEIKTEVASLRAVHQRLQTLTERIDSLSATQHQPLLAIAEIKDGIGAIRALYERMQTLTDRIDRMSASQRDPEAALEQFKTGIAAMRDVQERLLSLTERMDGMAIERLPELALDEIKDEIAAMRREMAARPAADAGPLDDQIRDLAQRLDSMSHLESEAATLAHLEAQIGEIASALAGGKPGKRRTAAGGRAHRSPAGAACRHA